MTKDIYSLCFIICIKPIELAKLCPPVEVKEEADKDGDKKEEDKQEEEKLEED